MEFFDFWATCKISILRRENGAVRYCALQEGEVQACWSSCASYNARSLDHFRDEMTVFCKNTKNRHIAKTPLKMSIGPCGGPYGAFEGSKGGPTGVRTVSLARLHSLARLVPQKGADLFSTCQFSSSHDNFSVHFLKTVVEDEHCQNSYAGDESFFVANALAFVN